MAKRRIHLTESQLYDTVHAMVNEALVEEGVLGNFFKGAGSDIKQRWQNARDDQYDQEQIKKLEQMEKLYNDLWVGWGLQHNASSEDAELIRKAMEKLSMLAYGHYEDLPAKREQWRQMKQQEKFGR